MITETRERSLKEMHLPVHLTSSISNEFEQSVNINRAFIMLFDSFELVILDIEGTGAARCTAASG